MLEKGVGTIECSEFGSTASDGDDGDRRIGRVFAETKLNGQAFLGSLTRGSRIGGVLVNV